MFNTPLPLGNKLHNLFGGDTSTRSCDGFSLVWQDVGFGVGHDSLS